MRNINGFFNFSLRASTVIIDERCWFAHFKINGDFSQLFPFIQSTAKEVVHYEFPEYIQFKLDDILCSLYSPNIVVARLFFGREEALEFANRLIEFLNEIVENKSQIRPKIKKINRLHVPEILHFLPMTNCGDCGYRTCMAFAGAIIRRKANLMMCPYFPQPVAAKVIFYANDKNPGKMKTLEVDSELAGFVISKINDTRSTKQNPLSKKMRGKRAKGVMGNRDGNNIIKLYRKSPIWVIDKREFILTAEFKINLLRKAKGELLKCMATVLKPGSHLSVVESEVFCQLNDIKTLVSKATITLAVIKM